MAKLNNVPAFQLIYIIANYGMGSKILRRAKKCGIPGGTIFLGRGTVDNSLLNFLSLYDERKEIVLLGADNDTANHALIELNKIFQFERPNHGIVFTTGISGIVGSKRYKDIDNEQERGGSESMYQVITTVVNRGKAEDVIEAAKAAGSKGGTIVNARGSGVNETSRLFNMEIEPEKEMILILSKEEVTETIVASIQKELEIEEPGNGIIFIQDVQKTYGIYE
ncbi:P-II family nitrogen regulator [Amphibacillus sp. Q70]|uniref:P-II family nitrogen regulator n=1 Tax=Amphibacillus sp. Q70 TaxID=3453416 RepID=UPI003F83BF24